MSGAVPRAAARADQRRRHARPAAVAEGRLREVRARRDEAAVADQEDLRRESRAQLGDDPARHAIRRSGHHRPRGAARRLNKENEKAGVKVTMLAFLIKASVAALQKFPDFNASLVSAKDGDNLVLKQYFHIGFAADTPNGLVVPGDPERRPEGRARDREGDGRALRQGARRQARARPTCRADASRSRRSAASAAPRSRRSSTRPKWRSSACRRARPSRYGTASEFVPRLMLPLSLSYDHRVIDGAAAARFTAYLAGCFRLRRAI